MYPVEQPFKTYTGLDGLPLQNGYVYFGAPNLNPITNPVAVYWDAAGTQPALQPLRTMNGYIMRAGTPANVFVDGAYSELVKDRKMRQVFSARTSDEFSSAGIAQTLRTGLLSTTGATLVGWIRQAAGAVGTTVAKWMGWQPVSAFDFMTDGQIADVQAGTLNTDVAAALQKAVDALAARARHGVLFLPAGKYKIGTALQIPYGVSIRGEGATASELVAYNCDGLNFVTYGYQIGAMFYEDFGVTSGAGANYTAVVTLANASTMDGLYFHRLRFYGWNECFNLAANWNCTISNCVAQNVNVGVAVAGVLVALRILNNRFTHGAGGNGAAQKIAIDIRGGTIQESIHVLNNQIYGFDIAVNAPTVSIFVNILHNDISALVIGIHYTTVNGVLNIAHNYIETFGVGLTGSAQSVPTPTTQTNIKDNAFVGQGGNANIGLILNTTLGTYQFNTTIEDNCFSAFETHDIKVYSPGKTRIENNRCMSTAPTYSIWIGGVIAGPVKVAHNWLNKALYNDVATDISTGLLLLDHNTEGNTYVPYRGTFTPSFIPQVGAFATSTYSFASGSYERIGNLCFFTLLLVESAHSVGSGTNEARISGLPFTAAATVVGTGVAVSDASGWGANAPSAAVILSGTKTLQLNYRATANGGTTPVQVTDMASGSGTLNRISVSGVYLCA